jgi:hypothetical protein
VPDRRQNAKNLALTRWHIPLDLIFHFTLSLVTPSTFKDFIFESEIGTARAISLCEQETTVLRITMIDEPWGQRWTLQGRLSGPWVAHLKSNWKESHAPNGGRKCVVDVSGVTFVDLDGERVLAAMMNDGAEFIASGVYTKHILEVLEKRRQRWIRKLMGCS